MNTCEDCGRPIPEQTTWCKWCVGYRGEFQKPESKLTETPYYLTATLDEIASNRRDYGRQYKTMRLYRGSVPLPEVEDTTLRSCEMRILFKTRPSVIHYDTIRDALRQLAEE